VKRLKEIDGLRGIAILLVVSFHYINNQLTDHTNALAKIFCKITQFGWIGVDLFFVLSGFLIGSILLSNKSSENYFKTFYIRRIVRIIPNYYLLILVFVVVGSIESFKSNSFLTGEDILPFWSYLCLCQNFFMAKYESLGNHPMGVTWSIAIEEQFYLIFPFILYKIDNKRVPYLLVLLIAVAITSRFMFDGWISRYVLLITRVDSLSVGMLVAWIRVNYDMEKFCTDKKVLLNFILIIDILICGICYMVFNDLGVFKHTLFAVIFGIMVINALGNNYNIYGAFLRQNWLIWIGSISYSLYLFHDYILGITYHLMGKNGVIISDFRDIVITISSFALSLLFSYTIYRLLETPMISIGKKFKY
jgi:peptidoglycan/LPS O-acetylase OafA/YrhL